MAIDKNHQGDFFDDYKNEDTKLVINEGVKQPPIVNPYPEVQMAPRVLPAMT